MPDREIVCADALKWLEAQPDDSLGHILTALPDMNDVGMPPAKYDAWFERACKLCLRKASPTAYVVFCQTDRKVDGTWFDKSAVVNRAAREVRTPLRWHKIVVRRDGVDLHRPTYSHLLCFSHKGRPGSGTPDVLPCGPVVYRDGMGLNTVAFVMRFFAGSKHTTVVDPFVGRGTVAAGANAFGYDAVGVDLSKAQCAHARQLTLRKTGRGELVA